MSPAHLRWIPKTQQISKALLIDDASMLRGELNLHVAAVPPRVRMACNACSHHIEADIHQAGVCFLLEAVFLTPKASFKKRLTPYFDRLSILFKVMARCDPRAGPK